MTEKEVDAMAQRLRDGTATAEDRAHSGDVVKNLTLMSAAATGKAEALDAEIDGAKSVAESASVVSQALGVLEASKEQFQGLVKDFAGMQRKYVEDLRLMRMSSVKELSETRRELADIRRFFLDQEHAVEVARLKEFVDVCERLHKLKESGFLDTIADTILKLS
jgi:hypothetical protein